MPQSRPGPLTEQGTVGLWAKRNLKGRAGPPSRRNKGVLHQWAICFSMSGSAWGEQN